MKKLKQIGLCFFVLGCLGLSLNAQNVSQEQIITQQEVKLTFQEELVNAKKTLTDVNANAAQKAQAIEWVTALRAKCESKLNHPDYSQKAKAKAQKILDYLND